MAATLAVLDGYRRFDEMLDRILREETLFGAHPSWWVGFRWWGEGHGEVQIPLCFHSRVDADRAYASLKVQPGMDACPPVSSVSQEHALRLMSRAMGWDEDNWGAVTPT
ncbi:MAG: hypothetical protein H7831_08675 [Magnetococcus sp. WYHC-3]